MSLGTIFFCYALGYFVLGYVLINDGAPWAAWTVMGLLLAVASTILRLDVSMTRSEYTKSQILLLFGPALACVVSADWATWSPTIQRYTWLLLPPVYLTHALFLLSFLRLCRVVEQPCGSMLPLSFRSVLYLDVFGWLTKRGRVKASKPSATASPDDPEYDAVPLVTCKDVCEVMSPNECFRHPVPTEAKMSEQEERTVKNVSSMVSTFSRRTVQEHLNESERIQVKRLSERLQQYTPATASTRDEFSNRSSEWVQLSHYSDCGRKVPYFVNVSSGEVSHDAPQTQPENSPADSSFGLPPSLSFAEQQVEALRSRSGTPACPTGSPVSFAPGGGVSPITPASSCMSIDATPRIEEDRRSSRSYMKQQRSRRKSYVAVHGQNFPRHFDVSRPTPLRPEDVEFQAVEEGHSGSETDDDDDHHHEEHHHRMYGVGPTGVVPDASEQTFEPSTFAPEAHPRGVTELCDGFDGFATGRDLFKPGQLPWHTFQAGVRMLSGLFLLAMVWSMCQAVGLPDIPDKVLPESVHVAGEVHGSRSSDGLRDKMFQGDDVGLLPPGERVYVQWPSQRFQPRGLSSDPTGTYFAMSDEFDIFFATLREDKTLDDNTTWRLDITQPAPHCPALEGQANRDVALMCADAQPQEKPDCSVMVLHARGRRVAACHVRLSHRDADETKASDDDQRDRERLLREEEEEAEGEEDDDDEHGKTGGHPELKLPKDVWELSGKWLRNFGGGMKPEEIISVVVDSSCHSTASLDERDSCMVVGTSHGRVVAFRPHMSESSELVPAKALWNVLGKAAITEQVRGLATSLMTSLPGGFVLALREGQQNLHAIDAEKRHIVGKWRLPFHRGRRWTALAGGATHIYLASQGGACADSPAQWVDSKGYSCEDYVRKKWCTKDGKYGLGWSNFWGAFDRYRNSAHTAMTACCACGGGDREDEGASSQLWRFALPEELRAGVKARAGPIVRTS